MTPACRATQDYPSKDPIGTTGPALLTHHLLMALLPSEKVFRPPPSTAALARLQLGYSSATSRLYLGYISPISRLHLGYISATSRLHLAHISARSSTPTSTPTAAGSAFTDCSRRTPRTPSAHRLRCPALCIAAASPPPPTPAP